MGVEGNKASIISYNYNDSKLQRERGKEVGIETTDWAATLEKGCVGKLGRLKRVGPAKKEFHNRPSAKKKLKPGSGQVRVRVDPVITYLTRYIKYIS